MILKSGDIKRHGSHWLPWHTFFLLLIGLVLYVFAGPAPEALVYDRQAITHGELWRLFTAHWVHADREHLVWNLLALGILGWMLESSLGRFKLYAALLAGITFVSAWLWWFIPSLDYYCGLSGTLNTLLFVILLDGWRRSGSLIFLLVAMGASAKIGVELMRASAIFTNTSWPAVPEAHLAGALAAMLIIFYPKIMNTGFGLGQSS